VDGFLLAEVNIVLGTKTDAHRRTRSTHFYSRVGPKSLPLEAKATRKAMTVMISVAQNEHDRFTPRVTRSGRITGFADVSDFRPRFA